MKNFSLILLQLSLLYYNHHRRRVVKTENEKENTVITLRAFKYFATVCPSSSPTPFRRIHTTRLLL